MPGDAATAAPTMPPTCSIKGLVAFGPGLHKGELYTPQRAAQVAANFAATGGRPVPLAKIGHDRQQQFALSLGFPNVGQVTRCEPVAGHPGCWDVDIDNVPTEVGGKVNAGRLRGTSVELKSRQRDPKDPARELPGDVLTGISLLGNEQPAVQNWPEALRARAVPKATFADGSPVPANHEMARWLNLAAEVSERIVADQGGEFSADRRTARIRGRVYAADALCFSDFTPDTGPTMTPEQEAALQAAGFTPEQIAAMKAALPAAGGTTAAAAAQPAPAPGAAMSDKDAPPWAKEMSDCVKKMSAELDEQKKRVGELQASADAGQKKDEEAKMAAFSDLVERDIEGEKQPDGTFKGGLGRKLTPVAREALKKTLVQVFGPQVKAFSTEADRLKAYRDELTGKLQLPDDPRLAPAPGKPESKVVTAATNPVLAAMTAKGTILDRVSPDLAKKYREGAAA